MRFTRKRKLFYLNNLSVLSKKEKAKEPDKIFISNITLHTNLGDLKTY